jgi:hypothetical protein
MSDVLFELIRLRLRYSPTRVRLSIIVGVDCNMPVLGCVEGAEIEGMRALSETEGFVMVALPPRPAMGGVRTTDEGGLTTEFLLFIPLMLLPSTLLGTDRAGVCLLKVG